MKKIFSIALLAGLLLTFEAFAQNYPQVVIYETSDDVSATFTTVGADAKSKNVQDNAVKSLFYTLFYVGVDGVNDGKPLIVNDNKSYIETFFASRIPFFVKSVAETVKPARNANKIYQGTYAVTVVYSNLIKDLERNKLIVAQGEDHPMLYSTNSIGGGVTWIGDAPIAQGETLTCTARYRYRQPDQPVEVTLDGDKLLIHSLVPQRAVTPGQSCVLYQGETCLGGAVVEKVLDPGQG